MASKKYKQMPDISQQDCFICEKYTNIDFRKAKGFTLHTFYNCIFHDCNFADVRFINCTFISCVFDNCNLINTNWGGVNVENTRFSRSSLRAATFDRFNFRYSNFYGTILCGAKFIDGYFIDSSISSIIHELKSPVEFTYTTRPYKGAIFNHVKFDELAFNHINFNKIFMKCCSFNGCKFDSSCKNIPYIPMTCPEEGSFIAYKKVLTSPYGGLEYSTAIAVLEIPADAKRSSGAGTRKCRCNKAKVLKLEDMNGNILNEFTEGYSYYNHNFIYRVGEYVTEDDFDEDRWEQCSKGIHFFMNRQEAINYNFN